MLKRTIGIIVSIVLFYCGVAIIGLKQPQQATGAILSVPGHVVSGVTMQRITTPAYETYSTDEEEPPIVVVYWKDITAVSSWNDDEEPYMATFYTVGWLMEDEEGQVVIASSWDEIEGEWAEFNVFPKGVVLSITKVGE